MTRQWCRTAFHSTQHSVTVVNWGEGRQAHRKVPACAQRAQPVQCSTHKTAGHPRDSEKLFWLPLLTFSLTGKGELRHRDCALAAEVEEVWHAVSDSCTMKQAQHSLAC